MENDILKIMEWNLNFASSDDVKPASFIRDYLIEDYINVFTEVRANEGLQEIGNELDYDSILSDDTEESSNQIVIMAPKAYNLQEVQGALGKSPAPDFLHGIITVDQKKVNIIGTRIRVLDYKERFKQLQALNEYIENINGAVVCMGDFNSGQIRGDEKASYNEVKSLYEYTKEKKLSDLRFYNFHIIKEIFLEKAHLIEPKGEDNSWGLLERNGKILPGYPGARVKNDLLLYSKDLNLVSSFYSWKHVRDNEQIYLDMLFKNSKRQGNKIEHGYPDHARLIAELEV